MAKTDPKQTNLETKEVVKSDFPKHTLEEALRIAQAISDKNGSSPLPPTETALAAGISPTSSSFRMLLSSSMRYGLTTGSHNAQKIVIEPIGLDIVEPKSPEGARAARIKAAFTPKIFQSIYNAFKGKKLPEPTFFQNTIVRDFGIPKDHAAKCIEVFIANIESLGLLNSTATGKFLASDPSFGISNLLSPGYSENHNGAETDNTIIEDSGYEPPADTPMPEKKVIKNAIFLGHGKNRKPLEQLKAILDQFKITSKIAVEESNKFRPISQKVAEIMHECGAAILIFTADEEFVRPNGDRFFRPNENAIYELGAASVLYGNRIIIFKEDGVEFPSNFKDIGYISFERDNLSGKMMELMKELLEFGLISVTVNS